MKDRVRRGWDHVQRDAHVATYTTESRAMFRVNRHAVCSVRALAAEEAVVARAPCKPARSGSSHPQHVVAPETIAAHVHALGPARNRDAETWAGVTSMLECPAVDVVVRGGWGSSVFG